MSFGDIFPGIVQLVAAKADVLSFRPRPGLDFGQCSRWIIPRRWAPPSVFAISRKGNPQLPLDELDLVCADNPEL
jgi:hypothetical protein